MTRSTTSAAGRRTGGSCLVYALVVAALTGCGGDADRPGPATSSGPVEAQPFKRCIVAGGPNRGDYSPVKAPAHEVQAAADRAGSEFFGVRNGDGSLVYLFVLDDAAAAEKFSAEAGVALGELTTRLGKAGDAGAALSAPLVAVKDSITIGLLPSSKRVATALTDSVLADIASCLEEVR